MAGYTQHLDEEGRVTRAPPFEKVAEDFGAIGESWVGSW